MHRLGSLACIVLTAAAMGGCSVSPILEPANNRPFDFKTDAFAYANELEWDYKTSFAPTPGQSRENRDKSYTRHCIVMARTARQFFQFARFDSKAPKRSDETYRALIRGVIEHSPSESLPPGGRIVIPGYRGLREFSTEKEQLLKEEIGSWAGSYFQLGNWRMIFPFSRGHQEDTAHALLEEVRTQRPPVVHLVRFPVITINHGVLIYGARETQSEITFDVYDPNEPDTPALLTYDKATRTFNFPANRYFVGGPLNVYEIFRDGIY